MFSTRIRVLKNMFITIPSFFPLNCTWNSSGETKIWKFTNISQGNWIILLHKSSWTLVGTRNFIFSSVEFECELGRVLRILQVNLKKYKGQFIYYSWDYLGKLIYKLSVTRQLQIHKDLLDYYIYYNEKHCLVYSIVVYWLIHFSLLLGFLNKPYFLL